MPSTVILRDEKKSLRKKVDGPWGSKLSSIKELPLILQGEEKFIASSSGRATVYVNIFISYFLLVW